MGKIFFTREMDFETLGLWDFETLGLRDFENLGLWDFGTLKHDGRVDCLENSHNDTGTQSNFK